MSTLILPSNALNMLEYLYRNAWKALNKLIADDRKQANIYSIYTVVHWAKWLSLSENLLAFLPASWNSFKYLWEYPRFPFKEDLINEWFVQRFTFQDEKEEKALNIINVDRGGRRTKAYTEGQIANFPEAITNEQFEVYFHGTDTGGDEHIIENGIQLDKGKEAQDFSDGNGFYVTNNFDEADTWANRRFPWGTAVLVYRIDKRELRGDDDDNGLDLRNDKGMWRQVVREYRHAGEDSKMKKVDRKAFRKELSRSYDFIEGPQALVRNRHVTENHGSYALCVRSDRCVQLFNGNLYCAIFFES